jgi:hypothetical protein
MRSGVCLVDKDTSVTPPHLLLDGNPSQASAQTAIKNTRTVRSGCHLSHLGSVTLAVTWAVTSGSCFPRMNQSPRSRRSFTVLRPIKFFPALTVTVFRLLPPTSPTQLFLLDQEGHVIRRTTSSGGLIALSFGGTHILSRVY